MSPLPPVEGATVALVVVAFLAGMTVPTGFGIERLNGFGRAVFSKLPYQPPPGMQEEEAMARAVERDTGVDAEPGAK